MIACAAGRFHLACRFTERKILIRLNTAIPRTAMYHCEGGATRDQPEFHEWSSGTLDSKITAAAGNIRLSNRAGHSREDWFNSRNRGGGCLPGIARVGTGRGPEIAAQIGEWAKPYLLFVDATRRPAPE